MHDDRYDHYDSGNIRCASWRVSLRCVTPDKKTALAGRFFWCLVALRLLEAVGEHVDGWDNAVDGAGDAPRGDRTGILAGAVGDVQAPGTVASLAVEAAERVVRGERAVDSRDPARAFTQSDQEICGPVWRQFAGAVSPTTGSTWR